MRVTLTVVGGPHKGQVFTFVGHDTFLVGRSKRAHFRLPVKDRFFSRVHFLVEVNPPQCRLMDMGSRNGTFVNGERVETVDLKHKDEIRAGKTVLRVSVEAAPAPLAESSPPSEAETASVPVAGLPPPLGELIFAEPASEEVPPPVPDALPPAEELPLALPEQEPRLATTLLTCLACEARLAAPPPPGAPRLCPTCEGMSRNQKQHFDDYLIIRALGRGSMGVVYLAVRKGED